MSSVFYDRFERHDHGSGLKGRTTHYCPGCGHGLAHKYLAEALEELKVQDRTVLISPVGCSVFAYYYFDTGNSQAAHGRAPVVALGHKLANPESLVISYQGDGDLASIGLAETIATAQMGLPLSVIFINNAIYGMTGGQLAPTSLLGQKTSTSPDGRTAAMGQPLRMAELIAQLDGPVYVERVALYDAKQRIKAKKAIKKALQIQLEGRGYAFVEVLAECPTHLKMSPEETETWVKECMEPIYPLGVKKETATEPWFHRPAPSFDPKLLLALCGADPEGHHGHVHPFPAHLGGKDISFKLAGSGGDGAQTAALLLARAAIAEGYDATHIPSYGPESRGGTSYADVHIAEKEVLNPSAPEPHVLIAFNAPSLARFAHTVREGGLILYDSTVIPEPHNLPPGRRVLPIPFTQLAQFLERPMVKNIVALGALQEATGVLTKHRMLDTMRGVLKGRPEMMPINEGAFVLGQRRASGVHA
ncbi:MAG TPA: 2-oxoacid:acceptor oxidoreductase family protein [Holophagaceae bacterium]|nr:2-oxoacid:acceptor oxidoreductase family protein [Holophagaceae bacterium]